MASNPIAPAVAPPPPPKTYTDLKPLMFELGQALALAPLEHPSTHYWDRISAALTYLMSVPVDGLVLFKGRDWSDLNAATLAAQTAKYQTEVDKDGRASVHRDFMPSTDEQFSTVSVDNLTCGIRSVAGWKQLTYQRALEALTWARLPTCMTAIDAVINGQRVQMVHPTITADTTQSKTVGGQSATVLLEGHSAGNPAGVRTATGHRNFDLERMAIAVHVGHKLVSDKTMPLEGILCEMLHAVISFTLQFVAPPFAQNVNFTQPAQIKLAAHHLREAEKCAANILHHGNPQGAHTSSQAKTDDARGRQDYQYGTSPSGVTYSRPRSPSRERK